LKPLVTVRLTVSLNDILNKSPLSCGCHIGSHSVTGYLTQVNMHHLTSARQARTWLCYSRRMEGRADLGGWVHTEMVCLSADSYPSK